MSAIRTAAAVVAAAVATAGTSAATAPPASAASFCGSELSTTTAVPERSAFRVRTTGASCASARALGRQVAAAGSADGTYRGYRCRAASKKVRCQAPGGRLVTWSTLPPHRGCSNIGGYGYVMSRVHVTCATAIRIAEGFDAAHHGNDCKPPRQWRHHGWQVSGPFATGLDYVFRRGRSEIITGKPTEC